MKFAIIEFPGSNCDHDAYHAAKHVLGQQAAFVWHKDTGLAGADAVVLPGGFSYGDYLRTGAIARFSPVMETVRQFAAEGGPVIGICNGFQVLLKAGILPGGAEAWATETKNQSPDATLTWNTNGKYTARWVRLKIVSTNNVFLQGLDELDLPIAHAEGRLVPRDPEVLSGWFANDQVGLCYRHRPHDGQVSGTSDTTPSASDPLLPEPHNPNGSTANIAGLGDPSGRVLGLMPHPERFLHATQHPRWTRLGLSGDGDGLAIFRNAVQYFA